MHNGDDVNERLNNLGPVVQLGWLSTAPLWLWEPLSLLVLSMGLPTFPSGGFYVEADSCQPAQDTKQPSQWDQRARNHREDL